MKGFEQAVLTGSLLLILSVITIASFNFSAKSEMTGWRLTRISMIHANLMAGDMLQDDLGIIDESKLSTFFSKGYEVTYDIPELEESDYGLPRDKVGYSELTGKGIARYSLPVVIGPNNEYGLLSITLTKNESDDLSDLYVAFENANVVFETE
ncbi:MAG: hypothetical protein GOV01_03795 [Candidatus Altiarchaeota archaeon]|nr:hypothetical protein [Candidatus Altiarchaeota archaeon]